MACTYTLKNKKYIAEIVPQYGMNCIRICYKGTEVLKTPKDVDILGMDDAWLFGMPVLFFPNRISNGRFEFEGREYIFPINEVHLNNFCHGDLHKLPFEVIEYDEKHIKGVYRATDSELYMTFPHSFEFYIEYKLEDDGVYQNISIKNTSNNNMPVALGFHTTFNSSDGSSIKVPVEYEAERSMETYLPNENFIYTSQLNTELSNGSFELNGEPISKLFKLSDRKLSIFNKENKITISYVFDEKFEYCMLYSAKSNEYICLEPQSWLTDCPNLNLDLNSCGFDFIPSNSEKKYTSVISASEE